MAGQPTCELCPAPIDQPPTGRRRRFCKPCGRERQRGFINARRRVYLLRYAYGLTPEQYQEKHDAQNGLCAVCRQPASGRGNSQRLHVDHNHTTGEVRGLLCTRCNTLLGLAEESPDRLAAAAAYLTEWN